MYRELVLGIDDLTTSSIAGKSEKYLSGSKFLFLPSIDNKKKRLETYLIDSILSCIYPKKGVRLDGI